MQTTTLNPLWNNLTECDVRCSASVVLLTNFIPPGELPYYIELSKRFKKFTILLSTEMEADRDWKPDWGNLDVIVQNSTTISRPRKHRLGFADRLFVHIPWGTGKLLKQLQPDVIVSEGLGFRSLFSANYCKKTENVAQVICTNLSEHTENGRGWLRLLLRRWLLKRADCVTVNGKSGARYLKNLGVNPESTFHVPYTPLGLNIEPSKIPRFGDDAHRLLFVGRLIELKGMLPFCEALSNWAINHPQRKVELSILGCGPEESNLKKLSLPENIKINMLGQCDYNQVVDHYATAGILVFPTLADEWGLVVNEAMSAGLPVLGSVYSQAVDDLVEEGNTGWRFAADCQSEIISAIDRAMNSSAEQLNQMRFAAINKIKKITPQYAADHLVAAVETALQNRRGEK